MNSARVFYVACFYKMESLITKATITEWSFGIIGIIGAVGGLCGIFGKILTQSRCSDCSCLWGFCKIKNDPLEADEIKALGLNLEEQAKTKEAAAKEEVSKEEVIQP